MSENKNKNGAENWTGTQAYTLAVVCLLFGIAGGWFFRGSQAPSAAAASVENSGNSTVNSQGNMAAQPSPEQLKKMADVQAAPLLDRLKADPENADLLSNVGNIYYDAQQYASAVDYYQHSLRIKPANAAVRTDLATAYWYLGNADTAITEFNKALTYEPTKANTLFNLGVVKWQGKLDVEGAVAAWQKLLDTNPNYEAKDKVQQLIAQARKHSGMKGEGAGQRAAN